MSHSSFVSGKKFFDTANFPHGFQRSGAFSMKEADVLTQTGALIMQIMNGKVQPADADQQAMLNVINGEKAPETLVEKTWMKYLHVVRHPRRMINLGATMGDGGSEESFSEDFE